MTKKHFIAIAKQIADHRAMVKQNSDVSKRIYGENILDDVARDLAITFGDMNENFNYPLFMKACGVE